MPIYPLPQYEADLKEHLAQEDRKAYEALKVPKTLVVRFGSMKLIGEFQYQGSVKPGCGSKVIVKSFRGTELGEMLTSTCPNSGCSKSVSRQEVLQYIDNSGGHDYPFYTEGRVLRIATTDDIQKQSALEQSKHELKVMARTIAHRLNIKAKIVEVEPILGGESVTLFYSIEAPIVEGESAEAGGGQSHAGQAHGPQHAGPPQGPHGAALAQQQYNLRVEMRDLVRELGQLLKTHVELRPIGARDEARLTADYEKCGQYCCCKNFLKVLRPVSMKSAKVQKATLDPLKISGRCGRLMCCLRYEDQTYDELSKRLPRKKSRVGTPEGDGVVLDSQILTQLVLVLLDAPGDDGKPRQIAVAVEDIAPAKDAKGPSEPIQDRIRAAQDAARSERRKPGSGPSAMGASVASRGPKPETQSGNTPAASSPPPREKSPTPPAPARNAPPPRGQGPKPDERPRIHQRGKGPRQGPRDGSREGPKASDNNPPQRGPGSPAKQPPLPPKPKPPRSKEDEIDDLMNGL